MSFPEKSFERLSAAPIIQRYLGQFFFSRIYIFSSEFVQFVNHYILQYSS